ncbi:MAG: flagellar hook-associated protein FlgK [Bacteroidales bacterium]
MSLTLGLNTALSGLLTSQRGLDVISQNVVNVNTKGYTRKVMTPESRVLAGYGAGVQEGSVSRMVNQGLLKDIRRQQTNTGKLEVEESYYPRIDDLFGEVASESSIAHKVNDLFTAFRALSGEVNKPATQWSTVQGAQDVADLTASMTKSLQDFRLQADRDIEQTVTQINDLLNNIHDLNQKIVKNSAISSGTSDLEDKRDQALSDLAKLTDIQYYYRSDNAVTIFSSSGQMLLDNQPQTLSYSASSTTDTWMTAASGQFGKIGVAGGTTDFGPEVTGGKLRALLDLRDKTVPNLQANLDEMSAQMRDVLNQVHNRGTSLPNVSYSYQGTRAFAKQGDFKNGVTSNTATFYTGTAAVPANTIATGSYGNVTWGTTAPATEGATNITIQRSTGTWPASLTPTAGNPNPTFSVNDPSNPANNGTYRVVSVNGAGDTLTVVRANPRQTIQLGGTDDVVIATFDSAGNQLKQTTLNDIMSGADPVVAAAISAYGTATPGTGRTASDFAVKGSRGDWSINEVTAHVEGWLNSQGYTNASVNLDAEGKLKIDLGDSTKSLVFRDQTDSTAGGTAGDATINFDVDGDGKMDESVKGFSNFFGLNDLYVNESPAFIKDSNVMAGDYKLNANRDLQLFDSTGKLGNTISLPKGSSLQQIADAINSQTRTNESVALNNTSWTLTSAATVTVSDASGALFTENLAAGPLTLSELAGRLTQGTVTAQVVQDGALTRLRLSEAGGKELSVTITNGDISGSTMNLGQTLDMTATQRIQAAVVPEGSGYRLRIRQTTGDTLYSSSTPDTNNQNLLSELGVHRAATGAAGDLGVRSDIRTSPAKISRGMMQWNKDTGKYYLSEGDNTATTALADAVNAKSNIRTAGSIYAGKYSLAEYASATISVVGEAASTSKSQMEYQTSLNASLDFQNASYSGVNLDEEISAMMDFQQAYNASAKVITTLQDMLETLTSMIR